jgi:hypothetical protein
MSRTACRLRSHADTVIVGLEPDPRRVMPRYLLVVNFEGGVVDTPMEEWKPEEITRTSTTTAR